MGTHGKDFHLSAGFLSPRLTKIIQCRQNRTVASAMSPILSDKKPFAWGVLPLHYTLKEIVAMYGYLPTRNLKPVSMIAYS